MAEQEDRPLYDYGEDVERYLTDKGSNIDELTKRHRHNVAESGANIESDIDDNKAVQRRVSKVDALSSSTTPIAQRSEQLHRGRPTVWSKVLENDPTLPEDHATSNAKSKTKKKWKKSVRKSDTARAQSEIRKSLKVRAPTRTQLLRDKKQSKAYTTTEKKSKLSTKATMTKSEKKALSVITGKTSVPVEQMKFIPKTTPDDDVLEILTDVLGGQLNEHVIRQTVRSSPFFSTDPAVTAKLKALTKEPAMQSLEESERSTRKESRIADDHPELKIGVVGTSDNGQRDTRSSMSLNAKLDSLVRKVNSRADQTLAVPKAEGHVQSDNGNNMQKDRGNRPPMTTEDIVVRATEAGVNNMNYVQINATIPEDQLPKPLLSPYLIEAFAHETTLVIPDAKYSQILYRPIAEPYGLDESAGPAYREEPPSTISYGGPVPPLESRKVRPITDTSPQIQDPINHVIKTPWEDVLADKRTVAAPCKRATALQKDFIPSDIDLGLDDVETIEPATIALATEPEKTVDNSPNDEGKAEEGKFDVDDVSKMKNNVEIPEIETDPVNQNTIDIQDEPPKGLVQELTAAIVNQLKAEGILAGNNSQNAAHGFNQEMMAMLLAQQTQGLAMQDGIQQQQQQMQASLQQSNNARINLADRAKPQPITTLGSALLSARIAGMSYDNQAPLRGIKTATMNPYRPVVAEQAKANVWQARPKPSLGTAKMIGQTAVAGVTGLDGSTALESRQIAALNDKSVSPSVVRAQDAATPSRTAAGTVAGEAEFDLNADVGNEADIEKQHISDEEPTLTAEQQKDLFTKCLNNRTKQVEELFSLGVPVDTFDEHGNTCLHVACQCGSKRMVKACLRWGADINKQNKQGQTALHYCFAYKYEELAAYLVSKGADDTMVNNFGLTCYEGLKPEGTEGPEQ